MRKDSGSGGYGAVEYSLPKLDWLRFYAGGLWASTDDSWCGPDPPCEFSAKLFFAGSKLRLSAPIPYVRPYLDVGVGVSVGSISTQNGRAVSASDRGLMLHIPLGLGFQIVTESVDLDIGVLPLIHPSADASAGALFAVGVGFDI